MLYTNTVLRTRVSLALPFAFMSSVSDWHKKQRKKEQQKNKASRIAARDERARTGKNESTIRDEIRKLEAQHKAENRSQAVQSKIDRLNKELKIVKDESTKKGVSKSRRVTHAAPEFQPLERPEISVHFDAQFNPYGEPPPGQPRLFHKIGGGVTRDIREACVPGEPLPTGPPASSPSAPVPATGMKESQVARQQRKEEQISHQRSSKVKQKKAEQQKKQLPLPTLDQQSQEDKPTVRGPIAVPDLPAPSFSVQRSKRKLTADIWASNDEINYEEVAGVGTLEGGSLNESTTWFYRDTNDQVQGPFETKQLVEWIEAGFFPRTTLVSPAATGPWKQMRKTNTFKRIVKGDDEKVKKKRERQSVGERVKALKEAEGNKSTVADRIAALKKETEQEREKEDAESNPQAEVQHTKETENDAVDSSIQARIVALKAGVAVDKLDLVEADATQKTSLPDEPAPYAIEEPVAAYAVEDAVEYPAEVTSYPTDMPYPTEDALEHPVADPYPTEDADYPVSDPYPTEDYPASEPVPSSTSARKEPITVQVDKDIVSFKPSNLKKRRTT